MKMFWGPELLFALSFELYFITVRFTMFGNSSGMTKRPNYKLAFSLGEISRVFCLQTRGMKSAPFEAFLLTHFWPGYTEEVDVWSAGDVVFLVWALESFHNMKLIKAEAHGAPPAWRPPPLDPGQNTLHISVDSCSELSVSHQAVSASPPICSPNHPHIPCLYRIGPSSLPHPHMISDYVFIWVVIIRLSPQMNIRCHSIMFSTVS